MSKGHEHGITAGQVFRYTMLPGLLPRFFNLFHTGFRTLAFYIAGIFAAVRIFPKSHPYAQAQNYQTFGLISVLAEGSRQVHWDRRHLDQVAVYLIVLAGFITLLVQFLLLGTVLFESSTAFAANGYFIDEAGNHEFFFYPTTPQQDYALRFLDLVFGLAHPTDATGFFESCIGAAVACNDIRGEALPDYPTWPMPMHTGLHGMIEFYNYMIIALAFVIIIYYFTTILAETAVNGSIYGQRGNKTWIPVRVIFFAALIMPYYHGFNLAQVVTLNAAYFGTGMASNVWRQLNTTTNGLLIGQYETLIAPPNRTNFPSSASMVEFMTMVKTCRHAERDINGHLVDAYIVKDSFGPENCLPLVGTSYAEALEFSNNEDIRIRFGQRITYNFHSAPAGASPGIPLTCDQTDAALYENAPKEYTMQSGYTIPYCGEITLGAQGPAPLSNVIRAGHYNLLVQSLWNDGDIDAFGEGFVDSARVGGGSTLFEPDIAALREEITSRNEQIESNIINGVNALIAGPYFDIEASIGECGWMCAAVYYNRIAEANGEVQTAAFAMPDVSLWPSVSEHVLAQRNMTASVMDVCDMFNPVINSSRTVKFDNEQDLQVAGIVSNSHEYFCTHKLSALDFSDGGADAFRYTMASLGDNPLEDAIKLIFGLNGLFDMRENVDIHPLAQLSILGKGMVESTVRIFGGAVIGTAGEALGIEKAFTKINSGILGASMSVLTTIGMIALTIGFILYYVIPFLPFVYLMFAAAGWVKGIFEAMVGVPLWALAHLRLDGEGIIGSAASSGYWLILEIMVRPILILTGFLASISIFMALVKVLNDSFDIVVGNVGGYNAASNISVDIGESFSLSFMRGPIDQFFYTVIYAIIVYMMAMSTFKLVDSIPQGILRWAGVGVQTFGDFAGDPASGLMDRIGQGITLTTVLGGGLLGKVGGRNKESVVGASNDGEA